MILVNLLGACAVFCTGLYVVLTRRNLVKIVMGLSLMEASTYLLFVSLAWRPGSTAPVLVDPPAGMSPEQFARTNLADPVLQNFCLTAIVIGVAVTGVFLAIVVRVVQHYGTADAGEIRELRG